MEICERDYKEFAKLLGDRGYITVLPKGEYERYMRLCSELIYDLMKNQKPKNKRIQKKEQTLPTFS